MPKEDGITIKEPSKEPKKKARTISKFICSKLPLRRKSHIAEGRVGARAETLRKLYKAKTKSNKKPTRKNRKIARRQTNTMQIIEDQPDVEMSIPVDVASEDDNKFTVANNPINRADMDSLKGNNWITDQVRLRCIPKIFCYHLWIPSMFVLTHPNY